MPAAVTLSGPVGVRNGRSVGSASDADAVRGLLEEIRPEDGGVKDLLFLWPGGDGFIPALSKRILVFQKSRPRECPIADAVVDKGGKTLAALNRAAGRDMPDKPPTPPGHQANLALDIFVLFRGQHPGDQAGAPDPDSAAAFVTKFNTAEYRVNHLAPLPLIFVGTRSTFQIDAVVATVRAARLVSPNGNLVIRGESFGAFAALYLANKLTEVRMPISLVGINDGAFHTGGHNGGDDIESFKPLKIRLPGKGNIAAGVKVNYFQTWGHERLRAEDAGFPGATEFHGPLAGFVNTDMGANPPSPKLKGLIDRHKNDTGPANRLNRKFRFRQASEAHELASQDIDPMLDSDQERFFR